MNEQKIKDEIVQLRCQLQTDNSLTESGKAKISGAKDALCWALQTSKPDAESLQIAVFAHVGRQQFP